MKTIYLDPLDKGKTFVTISDACECEAVKLIIDVSSYVSSLPGCHFELLMKSPAGVVYRRDMECSGGQAAYTVKESDTLFSGTGEMQLLVLGEGGEKVLTRRWETMVQHSLKEEEIIETPDPLLPLMEQVESVRDECRVLAEFATAAENERVDAEVDRETEEAIRKAAEQARVTAETTRETAEGQRVTAEQNRASAEAARMEEENARATAEQQRAKNEIDRQTAETNRSTAEQNRTSAEAARVEEENARATAEKQRAKNETTRNAEETNRSTAEQNRTSAEQARVTAETTRETAEGLREKSEKARVTAEQDRKIAEAKRADTFAGYDEKISQLKNDISKIDSMLFPLYGQDERIGLNKCNMDTMSDGWIEVNGTFTEKIGFKTTDYIDISGFESGYLSAYCCLKSGVPYGNIGMLSCCFFYDTGGNVAPGGNRGGHNTLATCSIELPEGAKYARVSFNTADIIYSYMVIDRQVTGKNDASNYVAYEVIPATPNQTIVSEEYLSENLKSILPWKGKTWLSYGDSITAIGNGNPADAWQQYVTDRLKFGTQIVRGIGGSTYKYKVIPAFINADGSFHSRADGASMLDPDSYTAPDGTTAHWSYMASWDRITAMIPDAIKDSIDLIFTFGVNDSGWMESEVFEPPVFSASNTTDSFWMGAAENTLGGDYDVNTFIGAWASCIMKLQKRCPNALVVCGTGWSGRGATDNSDSGDYNASSQNVWKEGQLVKEIANYFSVPCIDIWGNTQVNPWNRSLYNADIIHPYTDAGKKALARAIISGLSDIYPRFDIN